MEVNFTVSESPQCLEGNNFYFNNSSRVLTQGHEILPSGYLWKFGDGNTATTKNASHSYDSMGVYSVTLIVTDNTGYTDSVTQIVKVIDRPFITDGAEPEPVCAGELLMVNMPTIVWNGNTPIAGTWLLGNKVYDPLSMALTIADSGKLLRYRVESACGQQTSNGTVITVLPKPVAASIPEMTVCSGEMIKVPLVGNYTTAFAYETHPSMGIVNNTPVANGDSLAFVAISDAEQSETHQIEFTPLYSDTATGITCVGTPVVFKLTINPIPVMYPVSDTMTFCANSTVPALTFSGNVNGATYQWRRIDGDAIASLPASGVNVMPSFVAYNNSGNVMTINHEVTVSYTRNGITCGANKDTFSIIIYPVPTVAPIEDKTFCADETVPAILLGNNPLYTYEWRQVSGGNIGISPYQGTDSIPSFVSASSSSFVKTAQIEVTPRVRETNCMGNPYTFNITINPVARLSSPRTNDAICSEDIFTYVATSTTDNVTYAWRRLPNTDIKNSPAQGTGNRISEKLVSLSTSPVEVTYLITLSYEGCTHVDTTTVFVMPTPSVRMATSIFDACASDTVVRITFTSFGSSLEYMLMFDNDARREGFENTLEYKPVDGDTMIVVAFPTGAREGRYLATLFIRSDGGCPAIENYQVTINVLTSSVITKQPEPLVELCEGTTPLILSVASAGANVTYQWYKDNTPIPGATSSTYVNENPVASDYGNYHVVVTGVCGSVSSEISIVTSNRAQIVQKWDDVLVVSNKDSLDESLHFDKYQWYKQDSRGNLIAIEKDGNAAYYSDPSGLTGTYAVRVYYADGTSFMSCAFEVTPTKTSTRIFLYPNPVNNDETFNIKIEDATADAEHYIEIISVTGHAISTFTMKGDLIQIPAKLVAGVYVVRVTATNGKDVFMQKLIVH
ncbi:MAG: T9SS type A sorting domain-containing protein [Bacteroidales bacterium]|nr:T9SS type A sorting domain-containing protein [Bacteroidales bacterium]